MEGLMAEVDLYEDDFIAWTEQQAKALRTAARHPSNLGLDWEHLAEEIEDLGKSYRRAVLSEATRIVEHLLKLQFSPAIDPRRGWTDTVLSARAEIETWLAAEPAMRMRLPGIVEEARARGTRQAARALRAYGEEQAVAAANLHSGTYTDEQILGEWFPDARAVPPG
jgi:hypothetical protein